jgi:hypothetical protein
MDERRTTTGNTVLNKACSSLRWRLKRIIINLTHLTYFWGSMLSQAPQRYGTLRNNLMNNIFPSMLIFALVGCQTNSDKTESNL